MIRLVRRPRHFASGLLFACASLVSVLGAPRVSAQPMPDRRPLLGHVTGFRGAPLGGAVITIRRTTEDTPTAYWGVRMLTNALGEFTVPNAEDGSYYISVTDTPGYADESNRAYTLSATNGPFNLVMQKLSSLRIRVIKSDGTALKNATVSLRMRPEPSGAARSLRQATDGNGDIALTGLTPGTYSVDVLAAGEGWGSLNGIGVTPDTMAPNELRLKKGGTLHVKVTEPQADGTARPLGGASIFVTVSPLDDAQARAQGLLPTAPNNADLPQLADPSSRISHEGDGLVDLTDLAPGRYLLRPFLMGYLTPEQRPVEVKEGTDANVEISLTPQPNTKFVPITVLLRDVAGKPIPNADWIIQLRSVAEGFGDGDVPPPPGAPGGFGEGMAQQQPGHRAHSDADGKIVLYPVKVGLWRMTITSPRDVKPAYAFAGRNFRAIPDMAPVTLQAGQ